MAFRTQKISQMTPKGANLEGTDLLEVSTLESGSYVTRSITGQEIIDAAAASGGVTDVTATAPIVSTGGTTPNLSMDQADGTQDGYLSIADWNTFNDKQNGLTLTTTGTSGPATLIADTLNIPQYSGGGGGGLQGVHALTFLPSGSVTFSAISSPGMSGTNTTTNRLYATPFIPAQNITSQNFYINITSTTGGNARILIYSNSNGLPDQKLYESADLNCSTTGIKTATTTFNFVAGTTYWLSLHVSAAFTTSFIQSSALFPIAISGSQPFTHVYISATFGSAPT